MPLKAKSGRAVASVTQNIDIALESGNALIVALEGSTFTGTVDLRSTVDGTNYANHPYRSQHTASPSRSVSQISDPSTYTERVMLAPVTQARIAVARSAGSVTVTWREVRYDMEDAS